MIVTGWVHFDCFDVFTNQNFLLLTYRISFNHKTFIFYPSSLCQFCDIQPFSFSIFWLWTTELPFLDGFKQVLWDWIWKILKFDFKIWCYIFILMRLSSYLEFLKKKYLIKLKYSYIRPIQKIEKCYD